MFEKLWEGNQLVLRNALEAGPTKNTTGAMEKVFTYYESCLDKNDTLEELAGINLGIGKCHII